MIPIRHTAALLLALAPLLVSCGTSDVGRPQIEEPTGLPEATTIEILLQSFHVAYTTMEYEEYERCLDASYTFVFDPADVSVDQPDPFWVRADDLASTQRMFRGEPDRKNRVVQSIRMDFVPGEPTESDEGEGWKKVVLSAFELEVEAIKVDNGETWFLRTKGGYFVDVYVKQVETDPPLWKIVRIVDRPPRTVGARSATEDTTWGAIKSLY